VKLCSYLPELKTKGIKLFNTTQRLTWFSSLATAIILGFMTLLSGCGGGGASATPNIALSVDPAAANLYMGYPTTFTITGGRAPYSISAGDPSIHFTGSSNNTLSINGNTFEVTVDNVNADTSVTLTVRDADGKSATTSVTVKPASLDAASLIITGQSATGTSQTFISSGLQGTVSVTARSATGAPLMGHKVRFHVTDQGAAYGFVCNTNLGNCVVPQGGTDPTGRIITLETTTDQSGNAYAVIKADVGASTQYATISATDEVTGFELRKQFMIAGLQLLVNPTSATWTITQKDITITGNPSTSPPTPDYTYCSPLPSSPTYTVYYIYGGTPPYTVSSTNPLVGSVFLTTPTTVPHTVAPGPITVANNGGSFIVAWPNLSGGNATGDANIVVVDSVGAMPATQPTFTIKYTNNCTVP
jgi:hypothetical protein